MKKYCLAALLITGICTGAHAQKLFFVFAHGQYNSPIGSFKNNYNYGMGAEGGLGIGTGKTFFTGTIGYTFFNAMNGSEAGDLTYIPIKGGIRKYLLPGNLLFVHMDAGVATIKERKAGTSASHFTGDVGGGVKLGPLEVGVAYEGVSRDGWNSWFGFKAGWRIGL